ncbi:MAG: hypothetical protein ACFB50_02200, partial [Rubrobacteraceae bacterium]
LDEVRWECGHEIYAPSDIGKLQTLPEMIEHLVPVYMLILSLLAQALRGSNTSHCSLVRSILFYSCQYWDAPKSHYILTPTFMR